MDKFKYSGSYRIKNIAYLFRFKQNKNIFTLFFFLIIGLKPLQSQKQILKKDFETYGAPGTIRVKNNSHFHMGMENEQKQLLHSFFYRKNSNKIKCNFVFKEECRVFKSSDKFSVMYDTAVKLKNCQPNPEKKFIKLWEYIHHEHIFTLANLPTQYTRFVQRFGKNRDSILVFSFEPPSNRKGKNFDFKTCFKDSFIWGVLDTNVVHTLPFKTGIFNTFAKPNTPNFDAVSTLDVGSVTQSMPHTIRFQTRKDDNNNLLQYFIIAPVPNPLLKNKICLTQSINFEIGLGFFPISITTSLCECDTGKEYRGAYEDINMVISRYK